jgi:large conductance mechanosensitive channel
MLKEFREFILRGNLVDLAVAVVIGTAFGAVVAAFVKDLVTPLIAAIGGKPDFAGLAFTINDSKFLYGDFLNVLLAFMIIAAVVFFFVIKPVNALMARLQPAPAVDVTTRACPDCVSDIPISATRCAFCTSKVDPISSPPPATAT